jgi:hypothetical protein
MNLGCFSIDDAVASLRWKVEDVSRWQKRLMEEWSTTPHCYDDNIGAHDKHVLLNFDRITVIPEYRHYMALWAGAGYVGPLHWPWMVGDTACIDIFYIELFILTLQDQLEIWGCDDNSRTSLVYGHLLTYTDRLVDLYNYLLFEQHSEKII